MNKYGKILSNGIAYTGGGSSFSGNYEDLEGKPTAFGPSGPKAKEGFVPSPGTTAGTTKYLREDGTWAVPPDTDTTYSDMKGATASAAGEHGLAPAPSAGAQNKYLTGGATYQNVDDHAAAFASTDVDDGGANAWTNVAKLTSGEKHSSIFNKLSTMFKNVRYLYRMLGTTDISGIGGGTVTGAIRELNTGMLKYKIIRNILLEFASGYALVTDNFIKNTSVVFIQNVYIPFTESAIALHSIYAVYTPQVKDGSMYIYGRSALDPTIVFEGTLPVSIMIINP